jgi:hypothetical protein
MCISLSVLVLHIVAAADKDEHAAAKYGHMAVWGMLLEGKSKCMPIPLMCMVTNLAKSISNQPTLMRHNVVVTFFHRMGVPQPSFPILHMLTFLYPLHSSGHIFHRLLSKMHFACFHGTAVACNFVKAPSQMLKNWCWELVGAYMVQTNTVPVDMGCEVPFYDLLGEPKCMHTDAIDTHICLSFLCRLGEQHGA